MSIAELETMIRAAAEWAGELFLKEGGLDSVWHAMTQDDRYVIMPVPPGMSKDANAMITRMIFDKFKVKRCIFISEAWTVEAYGNEAMAKLQAYLDAHDNSLEDYPDKIEVLVFAAEDADGITLTANRQIHRNEDGGVTLDALVIQEPPTSVEGRFVGMISPEGKAN